MNGAAFWSLLRTKSSDDEADIEQGSSATFSPNERKIWPSYRDNESISTYMSIFGTSEYEHCGLSFTQRMICFAFFILMAFVSISLAFFNLPLSILKPQRFILP